VPVSVAEFHSVRPGLRSASDRFTVGCYRCCPFPTAWSGRPSYCGAVRFGVLGPLAVWTDDGEPVPVPGLKVRALLADLLVHVGRPVSVDRLIEDLWGARSPRDPVSALQAKVSQLRRALEEAEPGGRRLVVFRSPGYLLRVDTDAVDAGRFEALLGRARETDDPRVRAALLAESLALWRAGPFADFADEPFTRAVIGQLDEQRLIALEEQAETRLALGEHRALVSELGALVAQYPLRERLRATQLHALYRAGRQSEALESYGELRNRLREDLGLDPSSELTGLHQAILEQDPALNASCPPASPPRPRTNLPASLTSLVGRTEAITKVCSLLGSNRLVTLTGPGGVGKTRLALETATQLLDSFSDGVWVVELAALDPPSDTALSVVKVVDALTATLNIRDDTTATGPRSKTSPEETIERLASALRTRQLLLVLDNCEHVIEQVARLSELLLRAASRLRLLVTSRNRLGLTAEALWTVPPLELPDPAVDTDPGALHRSSAVQLFLQRVRAVVPHFQLGADNGHAVATICRRLDGIPLALELAATRVRALGVHELAARLDDRFRLLAIGTRGAPPRQQTLQAMIDWSWELLTEPERTVLRRLAVHADGCTLQAAEAVCAGDNVRPSDVVDLLARLIDHSLVVVTDGAGGIRYRLLESIADYCLERLRAAGEFERVRHRHARYYTTLAERAEPQLRGHDQRQWLQCLDTEGANLRSALEGAVQQCDAGLALRLVNAMAWYWYLRGRLREASRSLKSALTVKGKAPAAAHAEARTWQVAIALLVRDGADPVEQNRPVLKLSEGIDDPGRRARVEWFLGFVLWGGGDVSIGKELVNRALASFRRLADRWGVAAALSTRAAQALVQADLAALQRDGEQSVALFRELGDRWGQLQATYALSSLAEINGDYRQAARLHREGLRMAEEIGLWPEVSLHLSGLGRIALLTGDYTQAEELHKRAMRLAAEQGYKPSEVFAEVGLGLGARKQGKLEIAERHMRNVLEWNRRMGYQPGVAQALAELGFIAEQRGDADAAWALHRDGFAIARKTGDARAIALALEGLAGAQALVGHHDQAARLLGTAATVRESVGAALPPAERSDVDRIAAKARAELGADTFATEFHRGGGLRPEDHFWN
jgi:predicted ATPase/DNA-binding SARP family transcriptional activator